MIYGRDVSNWQGSYQWPDDLAFGFAKASEGTGFVDAQFAHNWTAMAAKKMVRGAYHFGHPDHNPTTEANHFLSVVRARGLHDGDLLALDLETTDGNTAAHVASWARQFCAHVTTQVGRKPLLYTFVSFARGGYCAGLGTYPLWIAAPSNPAGHPPMPLGPWSSWAVHQYGWSPVDLDCSHLTAAQLRALGGDPTQPAEEDDMPDTVSLGTTKPVKLTAGKKTRVLFDKEYEDPKKMHADGQYPGVLTRPCKATTEVTVTGATGTAELVAHNMKSGAEKSLGAHPMGTPFTALTNLYAHEHLYVDLTADKDVEVHPYVKSNFTET